MKTLKVFGRVIALKYQKGLLASTGAYAHYEYESMEITFDARFKTDLKPIFMQTLVHEIGHAVFHRAGLGQAGIPTHLEEIIVEQIATVLTENFKLTPK